MSALGDYLYESIRGALETVTDDERSDIHVVSLFTYDEEDDRLRPTAAVGFNTESQVASWGVSTSRRASLLAAGGGPIG